jgi:hypothetical protein
MMQAIAIAAGAQKARTTTAALMCSSLANVAKYQPHTQRVVPSGNLRPHAGHFLKRVAFIGVGIPDELL